MKQLTFAIFLGAILPAVFGGSLAIADSSPTPLPSLSPMPVPCAPSPSPASYLRSCNDVINGSSSNANAPVGMIKQIQAQTNQEINGTSNSIYSGSITTPDGKTVDTGSPVCDPIASSFNANQPELTQNHLSQSCGTIGKIQVTASSSGISDVLTLASNAPEWSWFYGLKVPMMQCYSAKIQNELANTQTLMVAPYCQAIAQKLQSQLSQAQTLATNTNMLFAGAATAALPGGAQTSSNLAGQANIKDLWQCNSAAYGSNGQSTTDTNSKVARQSAQQLCNARAALESMFVELSMCEIESEAQAAFRNVAGDPKTFLNNLTTSVANQVTSQCQGSCNSCDSYGCCSNKATQCANQNYPAALLQYMQGLANQFPTSGSCQ